MPLEAMNHGKAVVANAQGGPLESITDGVSGILVAADDAVGWVRAISRLALDPEENVAMGRRAHECVRRYGWSDFVRTIDDSLTHWSQHSIAASPAPTDFVEDAVLGAVSDETAPT